MLFVYTDLTLPEAARCKENKEGAENILYGNRDASKLKMMFQHRFINKTTIQMCSPSAVPSSITGSCTEPLPHCQIWLKHLLNPHLSSHMCTHTHTHCSFSLSSPTLCDGSFLPIQQNSPDAVVMSLPWTKEIRWPYWDPIDTHTLSYTHNSSLRLSQCVPVEWEVNKDLAELLHWLVIGTLGLFDYM